MRIFEYQVFIEILREAILEWTQTSGKVKHLS